MRICCLSVLSTSNPCVRLVTYAVRTKTAISCEGFLQNPIMQNKSGFPQIKFSLTHPYMYSNPTPTLTPNRDLFSLAFLSQVVVFPLLAMDNVHGLSYRRETYDVSRPLVCTFPTLPQVVDLLSPEIPVEHLWASKFL